MGIFSWWSKFRAGGDEEAVRRAEERSFETAEERRYSSGDVGGLEADTRAGRPLHEQNIGDAKRFGDGD
jgi:hypothetical protein